jgi:glutamate-ammonia-ligase adenylyltransferase
MGRYDARVKFTPSTGPARDPGIPAGQAREAPAAGLEALPAPLAVAAPRVLAASAFVRETLARNQDALLARLADPAPTTHAALAAALALDEVDEAEAMARLRQRRQIELAAIAWRDLAGVDELDRTLLSLSSLADALIAIALEKAAALLAPRHGRPCELLVLAMGKLGGQELNFSSDVDLVLLYPDPPDNADAQALEDYCRRLAQRLIKLLDEKTPDGFVYRVDTRLRPFGTAGPLALSVDALETYLMQHGRDWERYAYIKARLITGGGHAAEVFNQVLTPFVYRRYLDYGVFESLRQMKRLISQEVARKDKHDDIKLGRGGIREIEFIAQLFQLVRGGQDKRLRSRSLLEVLDELGRRGIIAADKARGLAASYRYLRKAENCLQALDDQQTHAIPRDEATRQRWADAMAADGWDALAAELELHRSFVQRIFDEIGWEPPASGHGEAERDSVLTAWDSGRLVETSRGQLLAPLDLLRRSSLYQRMDETSRQRLGAFVARLVPALDALSSPAEALGRVMPVIQAICRRSAYLALLLENPAALERLLGLADQCAMLTRLVAEHPLLLDELLDPRLFDSPPTRAELEASLARHLAPVEADDTEGLLNAMRHFQRAAVFRVALADRFGGLPLMKVSDRLTDIAELVLNLALGVADRELKAKHGAPMHGQPGALSESALVIVAYGKLGGLELGYGSDLDLVFLHDSEGEVAQTAGPAVIDNQRYFVRLVQRIIHILSVQTSSGRLYEIDTRLRPSGASGLMVTTLSAFARYQREEAWTWEHQALLRSRSVGGPKALRAAFERIRVETLTGAVHRNRLKDDVAKMRQRMRDELSTGTAELFDIKQDRGGLADIEFLIDYWALAHADRHPALVTWPDNVRQLEALDEAGLVPTATCLRLKEDYLCLRARTHELALADGGRHAPIADFEELRARVIALWEATFGPTAS